MFTVYLGCVGLLDRWGGTDDLYFFCWGVVEWSGFFLLNGKSV